MQTGTRQRHSDGNAYNHIVVALGARERCGVPTGDAGVEAAADVAPLRIGDGAADAAAEPDSEPDAPSSLAVRLSGSISWKRVELTLRMAPGYMSSAATSRPASGFSTCSTEERGQERS